jgi:CRP-like cAMP-binding protein
MIVVTWFGAMLITYAGGCGCALFYYLYSVVNTHLLLQDLQRYSAFPQAEFPDFIKLFSCLTLSKNELFYTAGTIPKYSPFLIKGCMRQYYVNEEGEEKIVRFVEEGGWAGQIGSMRNKIPTNLNLQAIEDCEILGITIENADYGLLRFQEYQKYFVTKYPLDHGLMIEEATRIQTDAPEVSYLRLLKEQPSLLNRVPQHYIANYLGIRPETLSRIRSKVAKNEIS